MLVQPPRIVSQHPPNRAPSPSARTPHGVRPFRPIVLPDFAFEIFARVRFWMVDFFLLFARILCGWWCAAQRHRLHHHHRRIGHGVCRSRCRVFARLPRRRRPLHSPSLYSFAVVVVHHQSIHPSIHSFINNNSCKEFFFAHTKFSLSPISFQ